jgi:hypothetical protein
LANKVLNGRHEGCYLCGDLYDSTEHHIRKQGDTLSVYLCVLHHRIIHACGIGKRVNGQYVFSTAELKFVLRMATRLKLFKIGEGKKVKQKIKEEIRRREGGRKKSRFKNQ